MQSETIFYLELRMPLEIGEELIYVRPRITERCRGKVFRVVFFLVDFIPLRVNELSVFCVVPMYSSQSPLWFQSDGIDELTNYRSIRMTVCKEGCE